MKVLIALMTSLVLAATAFAFVSPMDDSSPINGNWALTMTTPQGTINAQAALNIDQNGLLVGTLTTPSGTLSVTGNFDSTAVRFYATTSDMKTLSFDGQRSPGAISGEMTLNGDDYGPWSAQRQ